MKHKKIWIISIILLVIVMFLWWLIPKILFLKALISLKDVDSVHIEGTFTLSNQNYQLELQGNANYANDTIHASLSTNYDWNPLKAEMYIGLEKKDIHFYLTTNLIEEWVTSSQNVTNVEKSQNISLKDIGFQKIKSDKKGESKYKIQLSKELFFSFASSYFKDSGDISDTITLYIYTKDNEISGIASPEKFMFAKDDNLSISNIDLSFSNWNGISDIKIPNEVKESSKVIDKNVLKILFS